MKSSTSSNNNTIFAMRIASTLLLIQFIVDLIVCPHSKVEESFQLQATHDLAYYGIKPAIVHYHHQINNTNTNNVTTTTKTALPYDHLNFPGVVPRTFTGPVILASLCHIMRYIMLLLLSPTIIIGEGEGFFDILEYPMFIQFLTRLFLLLMNAYGWIQLATTLERKSKLDYSGSFLLLITTSQFHMPFYASRMLPNTFALVFVLRCYTCWIQGNIKLSAAILVFATAVFRCDLLLLLASFGLSWLITQKLTLVTAIKIGIVTGFISLILTVPLDSILWQRLVWPEGEVLYFNTILGKSSQWGTSVWHWYFSSAIPKSMLTTLLLIPFSITRIAEFFVRFERQWRYNNNNSNSNKASTTKSSSSSSSSQKTLMFWNWQWLEYFIPVMGFVVLYSFLGHKEMRFIFPAIPGLNMLAAVGMANITNLAFPTKEKQPTWIGRIAFGCGILCIVVTWIGSIAFLAVSNQNYPGGVALSSLTTHINNNQQQHTEEANKNKKVNVHIDVASAMSGVSLFGQRAAATSSSNDIPESNWSFQKSGYEEIHAVGDDEDFKDFTHLLSEQPNSPPGFQLIQTIQGNPSLNIKRMKVSTEDTIFIHQRIGWND